MLFLEVHPVVHLLFFFCLHSQTSTTCWADYVVVRSRHIWFYECSTFGSSEANKCCREIKLCFWTTGNDWRQVNWPWQLRFLSKKTEENKLSVLHLTVVQIFKSCGCFLAHFYLVVKSFLCSFFLQLFSSAAWRWLLLFSVMSDCVGSFAINYCPTLFFLNVFFLAKYFPLFWGCFWPNTIPIFFAKLFGLY